MSRFQPFKPGREAYERSDVVAPGVKVALTINYQSWKEHLVTTGVLDRDANRAFERGQCHALALALHEATGWQLSGVFGAGFGLLDHVVVTTPSGLHLDATGLSTDDQLKRRFGKEDSGPEVRALSPGSVDDLAYPYRESSDLRAPDLVVARAFVPAVLRRGGFELEAEKAEDVLQGALRLTSAPESISEYTGEVEARHLFAVRVVEEACGVAVVRHSSGSRRFLADVVIASVADINAREGASVVNVNSPLSEMVAAASSASDMQPLAQVAQIKDDVLRTLERLDPTKSQTWRHFGSPPSNEWEQVLYVDHIIGLVDEVAQARVLDGPFSSQQLRERMEDWGDLAADQGSLSR